MPKIIERLKSLKGLKFSNNNLIGYIRSSIGNLTELEWLDLCFNNLSGMIPKCLVDSRLNLRMNSLHGTIPATFAIRNNFRCINLNGNQGSLPFFFNGTYSYCLQPSL